MQFVAFVKFASTYLFQIAREKSFDYLLIIYVWIYENGAEVDDIKITSKVSAFFLPLHAYLPFVILLSLLFARF